MYGAAPAQQQTSDMLLDILAMGRRLKDQRSTWLSHWEELASYFLPNREGFLGNQTDGEERGHRNYTDGPQLSRRGLSTAISTMLRPTGKRWFRAVTKDPKLMADLEVQAWLHMVTEITYQAIYDPRAKMEKAFAEGDNDLVTFGTNCIRIGWNEAEGHLTYKTHHLRDMVLFVDGANIINLAWYFGKWPLRDIVDMFGKENLPKKLAEACSGAKPKWEEKFEICHAVVPNKDYERFGFAPGRFPYRSIWFSPEDKEVIDGEGGYWEFPYLCARWDTSTGEVYGRSPAMIALDSARLANEIARDLADSGANVVRPPLGAWADFLSGDVDLRASGLTLFNAQGAFDRTTSTPIWPIATGAMPKEILEFLGITLDNVAAAFFRDILELPSARDADLTATEINARLDQYARQAAPVFSRVEVDYNAGHINRVFPILLRQGRYPEPPEALYDQDIEFEYESPLKTLRDKAEVLKIAEGLTIMKEMAAGLSPEKAIEMEDNLSMDALTRFAAAKLDLPPVIMEPIENVIAAREARAKKMEMAEMAALANQAAPALAAAGSAGKNLLGAGGAAEGLPPPEALPSEDVAAGAGEIEDAVFEEVEEAA